ncbi:MAG: type II toxin-antitoxin system RelE family toxin [Rectinemataceae bacterium]
MFELKIDRGVERSLKKLPQDVAVNLLKAMKELTVEALPHGCRKIVGTDRSYRIRVGDYRIVYEVDEVGRLVVIHAAGHRKDVYRDY